MQINPVVLVMAALAVIAVCSVMIYGSMAEKRKAEMAALQPLLSTSR